MAVFLSRPTAKSLRETLDRMLDVYDVKFEIGRELRYIHKVNDGRDLYFLANLSRAPISTWVELRGSLLPELWDPHTGATAQPPYSHEQRGSTDVTRVKITVPSVKSLFIVARQGA